MQITVKGLYRYPVKGLKPENMDEVQLTPGNPFPMDRAYAIEAGEHAFDENAPSFFRKTQFVQLMQHEKLALLDTAFDDATQTLSIHQFNTEVAAGALNTHEGRGVVELFIAEFLGDALGGEPRIVHADGFHFTDVPRRSISIINLASVRALEGETGREIDPERFRGNVVIDGALPFQEFEWVGKTLQLGGVQLTGFAPIVRCPATQVNPATGARDIDIPAELEKHFGHRDCGLYADVAVGGAIQVGDRLSVV